MNTISTPGTIDVLGIPISLTDEEAMVNLVHSWILSDAKGWVCGINALALNLSYERPWLKDFYLRSLLNCSEGVAVSVAALLHGRTMPKRIVWAYWIYDLIEMMERDGFSLYLLGGEASVVSNAVLNLKKRFPQLRMAGYHDGYFEEAEGGMVVRSINECRPEVLLVGMGMPKQEQWILQNLENLNVKVVLPVGALIDYLSGAKQRCPQWMVAAGLEWLYRLFKEPRRLWRRYLFGNTLFIVRVLLARVRMTVRKTSPIRAS